MITVPTVLILGSGASKDYGFPTGWGLKSSITKKYKGRPDRDQVANIVGCTPDFVRKFRDELEFSRKPSVDAFLEHRTEFIEVGKVAIAQVLTPIEKMEFLFPEEKSFWYDYIFNKMNAKLEDFEKNKLAVITFNYDRSFEQFLFFALKNSYGCSDAEIAEIIEAVPIIHVHGRLGYLPWQKEASSQFARNYVHDPNLDEIKAAAQNIKIVHDKIDLMADADFKEAHEVLSKASRIILLGFGYDNTNLQRLGINFKEIDKEIVGSCYGFKKEETKNIAKIIFNNIEFGDPDDVILDFLRKKDILSRPINIDIKYALLKKVDILSACFPVDNLDVSMYLRIIGELTSEAAVLLNAYCEVSLAAYQNVPSPFSSQESTLICQEELYKQRLLSKSSMNEYRITDLGDKLCKYIKRYDYIK